MPGASGTHYYLTKEQIKQYHDDGFLTLPNVVTPDELKNLETTYEKFLRQEVAGLGNDYSDITTAMGKPVDTFPTFSAISVMVPRDYEPKLRDNIYELRAAHIVAQLYGEDMALEYDRFIAKKPNRPDAVFHWHQDERYCTRHGEVLTLTDKRAVTLSLALDETTEDNGCIKYVVGSHKEKELREHVPVDTSIKTALAITQTKVDEDKEHIVSLPVKRGSVTIHGERMVHGSGGNKTNGWRRSYLLQFRPKEAVAQRVKMGITRSLNQVTPFKAHGTPVAPEVSA